MGHENGGWMNADQREAMEDMAIEKLTARIAAIEAELAKAKDMLDECRAYVAGGIHDYMNGPSERRECRDLVARIDAVLNTQEPPNAK